MIICGKVLIWVMAHHTQKSAHTNWSGWADRPTGFLGFAHHCYVSELVPHVSVLMNGFHVILIYLFVFFFR